MAAAVLWLALAVVLIAVRGGTVIDGQLVNNDDYMRMVQVTDWMEGAGWYGLRQPRVDPPDGLDMHWSRLPDIPIAATILALQPFLGEAQARQVAAIVVPILTLLALVFAVTWAARPILGRDNAPLAALVVVTALPMVIQLSPGRIDHHGWQLVLMAVAMGTLTRMLIRPQMAAPAVTAGCVWAAALWIGGEVLPWLVVFCGVVGVVWIVRGGPLIDAAARFALTLAAAMIVILPLAAPPDRWATVACDGYSIVYVGLATALAAATVALRLVARNAVTAAARGGWAVVVGAAAAGVLAVAFPECRSGPFGQVDPGLAPIWMDHIAENRSILHTASTKLHLALQLAALPVIGAVVALVAAVRRRGLARRLWAAQAAFLIVVLALAVWQIRVLPFGQLFALPAMALLLSVPWKWIGQRLSLVPRVVGRFVLVMALGPGIWLVPLAFAEDDNGDEAAVCDDDAMLSVLAADDGFGAAPRLVVAHIDLGPDILFATPHSVLAAPYHRNARGLLDAHALLAARDDALAEDIVQRRNVGAIVFCRYSRELGLYPEDAPLPLVHRLVAGDAPPWLREVALPEESGYVLYEVVSDDAVR